jgi:hypothetical protein
MGQVVGVQVELRVQMRRQHIMVGEFLRDLPGGGRLQPLGLVVRGQLLEFLLGVSWSSCFSLASSACSESR